MTLNLRPLLSCCCCRRGGSVATPRRTGYTYSVLSCYLGSAAAWPPLHRLALASRVFFFLRTEIATYLLTYSSSEPTLSSLASAQRRLSCYGYWARQSGRPRQLGRPRQSGRPRQAIKAGPVSTALAEAFERNMYYVCSWLRLDCKACKLYKLILYSFIVFRVLLYKWPLVFAYWAKEVCNRCMYLCEL